LLLITHPAFSNSLVSDAQIANIKKEHGEMAKRRFVTWKKLMVSNMHKPELEKLKLVNNFFNLMEYQSDIQLTGEPDYWMTPFEFLINAGGDCEDFSIAKYFTLIALGVPVEKLRITYVKSLTLNQAHMVLAYYSSPEAEPLILDNLVSDILPASKRKDLRPVYSFNGAGLWLAKKRGKSSHLGNSSKLSKWKAVLNRMKKEGGQK
jgi:predicted transglutaminase-like cysteine proteinase